ncbi:exported hypothetical protein [Candidatus Sulfotelmatomonas gaucii]|uniref:Uncharacterized protein n=1 Tax=Candidatus Sulfuritelmatomonas gaucii TaxID=2043161 RepID=A0A2N9LRE3_9BACT|nr:exported hypothetical protein [Candidatus Sulfotelmatomonas gaucii]
MRANVNAPAITTAVATLLSRSCVNGMSPPYGDCSNHHCVQLNQVSDALAQNDARRVIPLDNSKVGVGSGGMIRCFSEAASGRWHE